jgi:hypothetical protein
VQGRNFSFLQNNARTRLGSHGTGRDVVGSGYHPFRVVSGVIPGSKNFSFFMKIYLHSELRFHLNFDLQYNNNNNINSNIISQIGLIELRTIIFIGIFKFFSSILRSNLFFYCFKADNDPED